MAFGYRYWMVYLPETEPHSFLLFVHNPDGMNKLRSYDSGKERNVGQPGVESVFRATEIGKTRHECDPHKTTDHHFWHQKTQELNRRFLNRTSSALPGARQARNARHMAVEPSKINTVLVSSRSARGSQRQLQAYVNSRSGILSDAILQQLPERLREWGAEIRWVSPLERDNYREYRDAGFLQKVGLGSYAAELAAFWPAMGPSWDALGIIYDSQRRIKPGVILVEAKSHIPEIYGNGCQAEALSVEKIEEAMKGARSWCGVSTGEDWLGPLYQSANRIAHLYFLYHRLKTPAWLVNVYFTDDPIGPTGRAEWEHAVAEVKVLLGLTVPVRNMVEVYLPALHSGESHDIRTSLEKSSEQPEESPVMTPGAGTFDQWANLWMEPAGFTGAHLSEPEKKTRQVLAFWDMPVPGSWRRGADEQLLGARYRRGDEVNRHPGEHSIEHEILSNLELVRCLDANLVDGINAMPLARDQSGGRRGNVEADLLLLLETRGEYRLAVCEVKDAANTSWFAAIENLRQLKLLSLSATARQLFHRRRPLLSLPAEIPIIGLTVAPIQYYTHPGQKGNVLPHTLNLLRDFTAKTRIETRLAVWDSNSKAIREFCQPAGESTHTTS